LLQWFDPVVLPRTIRVFDGLPRTATGKLRRDALRQLFDGPDEIEVVDREVDGDTVQATLMVPEGLPAFDGHFPDHPVLPGVAQLDIVARLAGEHWADLPMLSRVIRLKFIAPVAPGAVLQAELVRSGARVRFSLRDGARVVCSGVLGFG